MITMYVGRYFSSQIDYFFRIPVGAVPTASFRG